MSPNFIPPLTPFERHPLRLMLQDLLRTVQVGDTVTYDDLSSVIGFDIHESPHLLSYARHKLIDEGIVFDTVIGEGIKRMNDAGALAVAEGHTRKVKNSARRATRVLHTIDTQMLTPEEHVRFGVELVRTGLAMHFGQSRIGKKLGKLLSAGRTPEQLRASVSDSLKQFEQ